MGILRDEGTESPLVVLTQVYVRARATGLELDFPILQTIT